MNVKTLEYFASYICHELVSPVSAINNGLEFLSETDHDHQDDALELVKYSANQATIRLEIFRMIYGAGSTRGTLSPADIYEAFQKYTASDGKIYQEWDNSLPLTENPGPGFMKIVLGTMVLARECLPRGGKISVLRENDAVKVIASGDVSVRDNLQKALNGDLSEDELEPKLVPPLMLFTYSDFYGISVVIDRNQKDCIIFKVSQ